MTSIDQPVLDFRRLLDQMPTGVCIIDAQNTVKYLNHRLAGMLQVASNEQIGQPIQHLLPLMPATLLAAPTGVPDAAEPADLIRPPLRSAEWRHEVRTGTSLWLRVTIQRLDHTNGSAPITADDANGLRLLMVEDVSQSKHLQTNLSEVEAFFRFAIQNTPVVLFTIDVQGRIRHFEGKGLEGVIPDSTAIIGEPLQKVYRLPALSSELALVMSGNSFTAHHRLNNRDFITYYNPITNADHQVISAMGMTVDITDQTVAYQLAREAELQYQMIFERVSDIVFVTDLEGIFVALNPAFTSITGYEPVDWIGKPLFDLFNMDAQGRLREAWRALKATGRMTTIEARIPTQSGRESIVEIRARLVTQHDSQHPQQQNGTACVGVARDITQRKLEVLQELQVELEYERLEMLNRFIHNVSHDIRTPLSVINSATYLIRRKVDAETLRKVNQHLAMIESQVQDLNGRFNNLLSIPDIHLRRKNLVFVTYDITRLLRALVDEQYPAAQRRRQELRYTSPNSAVLMYGMEEEIRRALRHLLTNAITYTPAHGRISVSITTNGQSVTIDVQDTGIGIAPENVQQVFEPFYRVDEARQLDIGGMGLGMTVAKTIIEAHQGRITLESIVDQGTTVTVELPFLKAEEY